MKAFRIELDRLRAAVEAVAPPTAPGESLAGELEDAVVVERFAAGAWTVIPEPGDGTAGAVRAVLGDVRALELLIDDADLRTWLDELGDAECAADSGRAVRAALDRWRPRVHEHRILAAFHAGARWQQRLVTRGSEHWPVHLEDLGDHTPAALWVRGDPASLRAAERSVAIVGARASTAYGELVAHELVDDLVRAGFAIVSGGAFGIDGAAHRATLATDGMPIAVLAGGLDRFYPAAHDELLHTIERVGCVVAEVPSGQPPTRWRFLARNRLIAALSSATVVVEAGARSGSINTAGHAASLGRPLGAVPGSVRSGTSTGCHRLLREYAAAVVERGADVLELIDGPTSQPMLDAGASGDELRVLDALSQRSARTVDDLAARAGLAPPDVRAALALLELGGRATERGAGWVRTGDR